MGLPKYIASREDWDAQCRRQLAAAFREDTAGFEQAWERRYPVSVAGAIAELKARGLAVCEDNFALFCDLDSLKRVGRNYILYAGDVDRVAETLVEANRIGGLALRRKLDGIGYAEERDALEHILTTRRQKAADAIGVSVGELYAAIRLGGISDPAHKQIDIQAAKAWFTANADNPQFQRELQEVA